VSSMRSPRPSVSAKRPQPDAAPEAVLRGLAWVAFSNLAIRRDWKSVLVTRTTTSKWIKIGIHWGEVFIGNIGTPERLDWTAIDDVVNTASRLEKACQPGSVLISRVLRDQVMPLGARDLGFGPVTRLQVKGKREALEVCVAQPRPSTD
jgi:class 3 adenylate cyclase